MRFRPLRMVRKLFVVGFVGVGILLFYRTPLKSGTKASPAIAKNLSAAGLKVSSKSTDFERLIEIPQRHYPLSAPASKHGKRPSGRVSRSNYWVKKPQFVPVAWKRPPLRRKRMTSAWLEADLTQRRRLLEAPLFPTATHEQDVGKIFPF